MSVSTGRAPATRVAVRYETVVVIAIAGLAVVRLICAAVAPLAFDEALYWRWSQHLAGGYLDHPPMTAFLIRIGTTIFGDTPFGVRVMGVLLGVPATWAVWRSGAILFGDARLGATAALFFNLTLLMAVGSVLITPDSPVVAASAFLMFALAKLHQTGRSAWWIAIGVIFGLGLASKYSMVFFAVSILAWALVVPDLRRWLFTPWPWVSALIAVGVFSPVLIWNAAHDWAGYRFQLPRLAAREWSLRYFGEYVAGQVGLATPPIFVLGCMGLFGLARARSEPLASRALISALAWPIALYFAWHSLHGRVQGNWPGPIYPAFAVAAAAAACRLTWVGRSALLAAWSRRLAVPVGAGLAAAIYLQAIFGVLPLGPRDPTARALGAGWPALAADIDAIRAREGATMILTTGYGLTGWLSFYLPSRSPVEQINIRIRWIAEPPLDPALLRGPMLFICGTECPEISLLKARFATVEPIAELARTRRSAAIQRYVVYRAAGPRAATFNPVETKPPFF